MAVSQAGDGYVAQFAAHCWPPIVPVEDHLDRVRRSWVLRLARPLSPDVDVKAVGQRVEERARNQIVEALGSYYSDHELELSFPLVKLVVVDPMHVLAHIVTRQPEKDITDAGMIAMTQVLRGLDTEWGIEDLQGIPKRFWLLLASVEE
jgi:hypothetical protein